MATRFYFASSGIPAVSPSSSSTGPSWDDTSGDEVNEMHLSADRDGSSYTGFERTTDSTANKSWRRIRLVSSRPLAAQTISGTVSMGIRAKSNWIGDFSHITFAAWLMTDSGSARSTFVDKSSSQEQGNLSDNGDFTYRQKLWSSVSITSRSVTEGDRLVIDIGAYQGNTTQVRTFGWELGDPSDSDIDTEDSNVQDRGWFEFSGDIDFVYPFSTFTYDFNSISANVHNAITNNTATVTSTGGVTGNVTYAVQTGSLPSGLSLNSSTGAITGTPTSPGTYTFTIRATNYVDTIDSATLTYTILSANPSLSLDLRKLSGIDIGT